MHDHYHPTGLIIRVITFLMRKLKTKRIYLGYT